MEPTNKYRNSDGTITHVYEVDEVRELRVYENVDQGTWSVADGGMWLPGVYDSMETALAVAEIPDDRLHLIPPVWRVDTENRPATMTDLQRAMPGEDRS